MSLDEDMIELEKNIKLLANINEDLIRENLELRQEVELLIDVVKDMENELRCNGRLN